MNVSTIIGYIAALIELVDWLKKEVIDKWGVKPEDLEKQIATAQAERAAQLAKDRKAEWP